MLAQMLDLDGGIVGQFREITVKRLDDANRMCGAVEEIRIAERDVLGAGRHLPPYVLEYDLRLHDPKMAVVHGNHRAVPAQMFAAAAGFRITSAPGISIYAKLRIAAQWRQRGSVRYEKL